ncbi:uncharacterized protein METZ01_LOCUS276915 [marine metagenome]|uniref:Uncharacterized protein n=1 Tax=marine metagenome TaxID=408172 RepID=A0A382KMZ0_9ZZZZ
MSFLVNEYKAKNQAYSTLKSYS